MCRTKLGYQLSISALVRCSPNPHRHHKALSVHPPSHQDQAVRLWEMEVYSQNESKNVLTTGIGCTVHLHSNYHRRSLKDLYTLTVLCMFSSQQIKTHYWVVMDRMCWEWSSTSAMLFCCFDMLCYSSYGTYTIDHSLRVGWVAMYPPSEVNLSKEYSPRRRILKPNILWGSVVYLTYGTVHVVWTT